MTVSYQCSDVPEVRLATQCPKDVSNIIGRLYTSLVQGIPAPYHIHHNFNPHPIYVRKRKRETSLIDVLQVGQGGYARGWSLEVTERPHDDDTTEIDLLDLRSSEKRVQGSVIFLGRRTIDSRSVGD